MNLSILLVVVANMFKKNKVKIVKADDGAGLCKYCTYCNQRTLLNNIAIGCSEYFTIACNKTNKKCYETRSTLITCSFFKSYPTKQSFFHRLWLCLSCNDWSKLRSS